jgi:hypothetical protein
MKKRLLASVLGLVMGSGLMGAEARWWKGNLHTHTLWSDGDDYPEMVADWYRGHGYHFLTLSDHNTLSSTERWISPAKLRTGEEALRKYRERFGDKWVEERELDGKREVRLKRFSEYSGKMNEDGRFLMIPSEEVTGKAVHINATNLQEVILPYSGLGDRTSSGVVKAMQYVFDAVSEQRKRLGVPMFAHLNHPNFTWAVTAEELAQVDRARFFEVYNGHPTVHNAGDNVHAGTEAMWDIVLAERLGHLGKDVMYGIATDDSHRYHTEDPKSSTLGHGWVVVRSERLEVGALVEAMERGDFYASTGVVLKEVNRVDGVLSVEVDAEPGVDYTIEFVGTRRGFDRTSHPVMDPKGEEMRVTRRYSADVGAILASTRGTRAEYRLRGDELYVRARVTSSKDQQRSPVAGDKERAWTQPVVGAVR